MAFSSPYRLYGRRKGRPLRAHKAELVATLLPELTIALPEKVEGDSKYVSCDPRRLFSFTPQHVWLEIGFGGGEHLAAQAIRHPENGFIGCEPFVNGVASLCDHIDKHKINNIRIFPDDARELLDSLPDASIERCFVLFPDPWPKARHAERRFIAPNNLLRLARVLCKQAELYLATDDAQLAGWMRESLSRTPDFTCLRDSREPPDGWTPTRYEQKGIMAGREPVYMVCRRN